MKVLNNFNEKKEYRNYLDEKKLKNLIINNFTTERINELRKNVDFSDIPEIKNFSDGHLRFK